MDSVEVEKYLTSLPDRLVGAWVGLLYNDARQGLTERMAAIEGTALTATPSVTAGHVRFQLKDGPEFILSLDRITSFQYNPKGVPRPAAVLTIIAEL
jgi:hypothetical protein